jgi:hypothetical protein
LNFTSDLIINMYSIVLLIFIYIQVLRDTERNFLPQELFLMILQVTMLMLVFDIFSRFDGNPGTIYPVINHIGNFLIYLFSPLLPSLWLLYAQFQVFHDEKKSKYLQYLLLAIIVINAAILILSQNFGWLYYIDSKNIYHRGTLSCFYYGYFGYFSLRFNSSES